MEDSTNHYAAERRINQAKALLLQLQQDLEKWLEASKSAQTASRNTANHTASRNTTNHQAPLPAK